MQRCPSCAHEEFGRTPVPSALPLLHFSYVPPPPKKNTSAPFRSSPLPSPLPPPAGAGGGGRCKGNFGHSWGRTARWPVPYAVPRGRPCPMRCAQQPRLQCFSWVQPYAALGTPARHLRDPEMAFLGWFDHPPAVAPLVQAVLTGHSRGGVWHRDGGGGCPPCRGFSGYLRSSTA